MKFITMVFIVIVFSFTGCNSIAKLNKTEKVDKGKWLTPSLSLCKKHTGRVYQKYERSCETTSRNAEKICRAMGGRLPSIQELRKLFKDCGGEVDPNPNDFNTDAWKRNRNNNKYKQCYEDKGFKMTAWSSTDTAFGNMYFDFYSGYDGSSGSSGINVQCVRN